jgi:hypothetical protein
LLRPKCPTQTIEQFAAISLKTVKLSQTGLIQAGRSHIEFSAISNYSISPIATSPSS